MAALAATLVVGAAALATDLSVQTHQRRSLENATDAAALAGAADLGASASQDQRITAANDALRVVYDHMGWQKYGSGTTWASNAVASQTASNCGNGASATRCNVSVVGPDPHVLVTVDIPPARARNAAYDGLWDYVEVELSQTSGTGFAGVIGQATTTAGAHSIAYHRPPGVPYGFALWSGTTITDGNQGEVVQGNVYTYRSIIPQSNGQAGFCAAPDSAGNATIVLGAPQSPPAPTPDPAGGAPFQSAVVPITQVTSCSTGAGGGRVSQTATLGTCGSLIVQGVTMATSFYGPAQACVADPPLLPPDLQAPTIAGAIRADGSVLGVNQSVLTLSGAVTSGVYDVIHNPNCTPTSCYDVTIDGRGTGARSSACTDPTIQAAYSTCLVGVTFYLEQGATVGVINGANALITPYVPSPATTNPQDGAYPVYAPSGSAARVEARNNGTHLTMTGTVYVPSGSVVAGQNATLYVQGQAIAQSWSVQSGNHLNPTVAYDASRVATERETLLLVE